MKQEHEQERETKPGDDYLLSQQLQLGMGQLNLASSSPDNINGDVEALWMQRTYDNSEMAMQSQPHNMNVPQQCQDFNEMYSFFDNIDDRQSYLGSKEMYESRYFIIST